MSFFEKAKKSMEGTRQDGCEKSELSERRILPTSFHDAETDIQKMPLSDFEKAGFVLKVFSEVLNEMIYFVSSDAVISPNGGVTYTATELNAMLNMTETEVRAAHTVKAVFHRARVIKHRMNHGQL